MQPGGLVGYGMCSPKHCILGQKYLLIIFMLLHVDMPAQINLLREEIEALRLAEQECRCSTHRSKPSGPSKN